MNKILVYIPKKHFDYLPSLDLLYLSEKEVDVVVPGEEPPGKDYQLVLSIKCDAEGAERVEASRIGEFRRKIWDVVDDKFVNLHHHDEFSIKDGVGTVEMLAGLLVAQNRGFLCVTNHGSIGGWIRQYNICRKKGLKPIFGMEAYASDFTGEKKGDDIPLLSQGYSDIEKAASHLILLASTEEGFYNIIRLHNDAQINGFYRKPRVSRAAMKKWGKGIVATSACMSGLIPRYLDAGMEEEAADELRFMTECFDEFYIEIQLIEYEKQKESNLRLIEFARKHGAPLIMAIDSHYLEREHVETQELLMLIGQKKTVNDKKENPDDIWSFDAGGMFYRSYGQLLSLFNEGFVTRPVFHGDIPRVVPPFRDDVFTEEVFIEACMNTRRVAVMAENISIDSSVKLPKISEDSASELRSKLNAGFRSRNLSSRPNKDEYLERIRYECEVICRLGWADYFLVMEKIVRMTLDRYGEFSIGKGRGSAAGSLVAYCLNITDIDPIRHGLLFERFLDESRMGAKACTFEV